MKHATKTILGCLALVLLVGLAAELAMASQKLLAVPLRVQEQDQWCWAGCSDAVLSHYKKNISQCYIADFGWRRKDCCATPANCNAANDMYGSGGSIQAILKHWCVSSSGVDKALAFRRCKREIKGNRPFIIRYGWDSGGGHFIIARGFKTDTPGYLFLMNPWPGEGYGTFEYGYVRRSVGHHTWTHTLKGIRRDLDAADWQVRNTTPVWEADHWSYVLSLKEVENGCGRIVQFYHDFYDENNEFINRAESTAADFVSWFDDCADKDVLLPRKTKFCGDIWTHLGGRPSGYVRHSFVIKCDSGAKITRRRKIALTGGAPRASMTRGSGPDVPATAPGGGDDTTVTE